MSNTPTGPRSIFNEFIRKIVCDLGMEGGDVLQLVIALRQRPLRQDLLFCLHNKAPNMRLSKASFSHLIDVLRALLRESNNTGDYKCISDTYCIAQMYGRTLGSFEYTLLSSLSTHEVWCNMRYWLQATDALFSHDLFRWQALSAVSKQSIFGSEFKDTQIYSFFAINRIQSIAFGSMRRLGVPVAVIAGYLKAAINNYGLAAANIDITMRPHISIIMGLLDLGIDYSVKPNKKESSLLKTLSTQESITDILGGQFNTDDENDVLASIHPRCRHTKIGFNALLEVVFYLASLSDPESPMSKLLKKMKAERAAEVNVLDKAVIQKYTLPCVCGRTLNDWTPIGIFDKSQSHREDMSYFLCEVCFRQCVSSLGEMGALVTGGVGKCAIPNARGERAQSFLCLFYGNNAARNGFQKTSGQHVRLHALGGFTNCDVRFKKRGKVKKKRMNSTMTASPMKSQKSISSEDFFGSDSSDSDEDDFSNLLSDAGSACLVSVDSDKDSEHTPGFFSGSFSDDDPRGSRGNGSSDLQKFVVMMQAGVDVVKIKSSPFTRHLNRTLFLDSRAQDLCWLPPGRAELVVVPKSSMPVASIKSIKVGSGKMDQCLSIVSESKTLMIKIEDSKHFKQILEGFMALSEANKKKNNVVGRQAHAL